MHSNRKASVVGSRAAVVALSATLTFGTFPITAFAEGSADLQAQLQQAQSQTAQYEQQAAAAFQELEDVQGQLEDTRAQIASTEGDIDQKQKELDAAQATLADRVSSNYKTGGVSLVSILFDSTSFEDLASRLYYANRVAESDATAIREVQDIQAQLDQKKSDLEGQQATQQQLVDDSQAKANEVQQALSDHQSYVSGLSQDVQDALAAEEAQRRAEEEAAAQKAAAQQATTGDAQNGATGDQGNGQPSDDQPANTPAQTPNAPAEDDDEDDAPAPNTPSKPSNGGGSVNVGSGISGAIAAAKTQVGVSYSYGGNAIAWQEFDCSGLVWWSYKQAGISIPRGQRMSNGRGNSMIGWCLDNGGWVTDQSQLQPGDLMFWGSSVYDTGHVGMYIGGGLMIHSNYNGVEIRSAYYNSGSFVGGGPIV